MAWLSYVKGDVRVQKLSIKTLPGFKLVFGEGVRADNELFLSDLVYTIIGYFVVEVICKVFLTLGALQRLLLEADGSKAEVDFDHWTLLVFFNFLVVFDN